MTVPVFVAFEGGEGSGKSLQSQALYRRLIDAGYRAMLVHEPGSTPLGLYLRDYLKSDRSLTYRAEFLLFAAARAELVEKVVIPSLEQGINVVADRYAASSMAYQGYGRRLSKKAIKYINSFATKQRMPDLVVLLDIAPEKGLRRLASIRVGLPLDGQEVGGPKGRLDEEGQLKFEQESVKFHQRVREGYLVLAAQEPDRWLVVDATLPPARIVDLVWERVSSLLTRVG